MKENVEIPGFDGMIGTADLRDLGVGVAAYAKNIDMVRRHGVFVGIPADDAHDADVGFSSSQFSKFEDDDGGTEALAMFNGDIKYSIDYDGTPTSLNPDNGVVSRSSLQTAITGDGITTHFGFGPIGSSAYSPVWLGRVSHDQMGITRTKGLVAHKAELERPPVFISSHSYGANTGAGAYGLSAGFQVKLPQKEDPGSILTPFAYDNSTNIFSIGENQTRVYVYYASAIYEGFQEGPLKWLSTFTITKNFCGMTNSFSLTNDLAAKVPGEVRGFNPQGAPSNTEDRAFDADEWEVMFAGVDGALVTQVATGLEWIAFTLFLRTVSNVAGIPALNPRVTSINIYRAIKEGGQEGEPLFLENISLADYTDSEMPALPTNWYSTAVTSGDTYSNDSLTNGEYYHYDFKDDNFPSTDSYSDLNEGISPDLNNMRVHWGLSTAIDGYHIIGNIWQENLGASPAWLLRSKRHKFNVFDWSRDFLILPTIPTALASYNGRLYAFSRGQTHLVNPISFDLLETWNGIGCASNQSFASTDMGLFWVDENNIYHHDGTRVNTIGRAILKNDVESTAAWENVDFTQNPICCYHPVYESFLVFYKSGSTFCGLMYHIPSKRWQHLTLSVPGDTITSLIGLYYRTDGIPALVVNTTLNGSYVLFLFKHSTNLRDYDWYGHEMRSTGRQKYYHLHIYFNGGSPPTTIQFFENDPDFDDPQTAVLEETIQNGESEDVMGIYRVNSDNTPPWGDVRGFSLRIAGSTGGEDVRHMTLVRKQLITT